MSKFNVYESRAPYSKVPLGTYETLAEALKALHAMNPIVCEPDEQNVNCYDAFLADGRIVCIEPVGFKINA